MCYWSYCVTRCGILIGSSRQLVFIICDVHINICITILYRAHWTHFHYYEIDMLHFKHLKLFVCFVPQALP